MLPSEAAQKHLALIASYPVDVQEQVRIITRKLIVLSFPAEFTRMVQGPIVRVFYFKPIGDGSFASILNREEEFAGALAVESVRLERTLGEITLSVPRADRQIIQFDSCLHNMLTSEETAAMQLPLLLGQTAEGEHLYADLAAQPHLLMAGTTGSGKSVAMAQLISSMALFREPSDLQFILVDTKHLDLVLFQGLKHVKHVIKEIEDLRSTLHLLLADVRARNKSMSGLARNIAEWNKLYGYKGKMKYKILIVDELADVFDQDAGILAQYKKSERPESIHSLLKTISQISRAAGVHLILATQRPSVKVISGDLKANFPARIAFKLPANVDSRVILDEGGAESLLGRGDFLYMIAGSNIVKRAHSAFVSTMDIANIVAQNELIRMQYTKGVV